MAASTSFGSLGLSALRKELTKALGAGADDAGVPPAVMRAAAEAALWSPGDAVLAEQLATALATSSGFAPASRLCGVLALMTDGTTEERLQRSFEAASGEEDVDASLSGAALEMTLLWAAEALPLFGDAAPGARDVSSVCEELASCDGGMTAADAARAVLRREETRRYLTAAQAAATARLP